MRLSLKVREAKKRLGDSLESNQPVHFSNCTEYTDYVLNQLVYIIHGDVKKETYLILYYEYKKRFGQKIKEHYTYA